MTFDSEDARTWVDTNPGTGGVIAVLAAALDRIAELEAALQDYRDSTRIPDVELDAQRRIAELEAVNEQLRTDKTGLWRTASHQRDRIAELEAPCPFCVHCGRRALGGGS